MRTPEQGRSARQGGRVLGILAATVALAAAAALVAQVTAPSASA